MIDTRDLDSYYPGYDEYCEPKENRGDDFGEDIDAIIDERRLQELEEREKETDLFKVVYSQGTKDGSFKIVTYNSPFLETICKRDKSTFLAIRNTINKAFENIEEKVKEESK